MRANLITKIGGEFEIDPIALSGYLHYKLNNNAFLYSSGRSALMAILLHVSLFKRKVIHIPYYICPSVVKTCEIAGYQIKFYELDENFLLPIEYLSNIISNEVLLTVNYFGFVDENSIIINTRELRPDIIIISDQVQSFWTFDKTEADYSFSSLRKYFPIPEGALIYSKNNDVIFNNKLSDSSFYKFKLLGSFLKHQNVPDNIYLKFFEDGEIELNNESGITKASVLAHYLYSVLDFECIKQKRKDNYKFVYEMGEQVGLDFIFPYDEKVVPLNIPILVTDRDKVRKKLRQKNVFLPIHWPCTPFNEPSIFAKMLGTSELSLVIDQRYSTKEIENEITELKNIIDHG